MAAGFEEVIINTHLAGVRQVEAGALAEAGAFTRLATATKMTGESMAFTNKQSFLMRQSLFTLRRVIYGATLAFLGVGVAALKMGNDYNTAIQGARVALGKFFPDAQELEDNLDRLWTIAKFSPFQIQDMTLAFGKMAPAMMRIGMTGEDVTTILHDLTDALSVGMAGRVTPAALNRASIALQHLAFIGRLTGVSVLQLARDGVPIYAALTKELGLTAEQMHEVGKLGIPAQVALQAIHKFISTDPGYVDAARRLSNKSVLGLWSQFKDNIAKTMGTAEKGWFGSIQRMLVRANKFFTDLQKQTDKTKNVWVAIDKVITPKTHTFIHIWDRLVASGKRLWDIFIMIFNATVKNIWMWRALGVAGAILGGVIWTIAKALELMGPLLIPLVAAYTAWKLGTLGLAAALKIGKIAQQLWTAAMWAGWVAIRAITAATWLYIWALRIVEIWQKGFYETANYRKLGKLELAIGKIKNMWLKVKTAIMETTVAQWLFNSATYANPYVLIAIAILAVVAAAVFMMVKWKQVHEFIKRHSWLQAILFFVSPFLFFMYEIRAHWDAIKHAAVRLYNFFKPAIKFMVDGFKDLWHVIKTVVHWLKEGWKWLTKWPDALGGGGGKKGGGGFDWGMFNPLNAIPGGNLLGNLFGMASGGTVISPGVALIGERGPELLHMPRGAQVQPLTQPHQFRHERQPININLRAELKVDGRKMAETVARHQTTVNARM